jgi:hypothetical protein
MDAGSSKEVTLLKALRLALIVLPAALAIGCGANDSPTAPDAPRPRAVITGSGDITAQVAAFRAGLGDPNNGGTAGAQPSGRREVNWDGVPANFTNVDSFPGDFFNTRSPRGLVMTTPGLGLRVSDTNAADLDPSFGQQFGFFSPRKTFLAAGSAVVDATFRVPGSDTPAAISGFGVVFSDVDHLGSATIELFGAQGSLGKFEAPVRDASGPLSFLGVAFDGKVVTRVRIVSGQGAVSAAARDVSNGGTLDLVIMDDFLYDEPQAQ